MPWRGSASPQVKEMEVYPDESEERSALSHIKYHCYQAPLPADLEQLENDPIEVKTQTQQKRRQTSENRYAKRLSEEH